MYNFKIFLSLFIQNTGNFYFESGRHLIKNVTEIIAFNESPLSKFGIILYFCPATWNIKTLNSLQIYILIFSFLSYFNVEFFASAFILSVFYLVPLSKISKFWIITLLKSIHTKKLKRIYLELILLISERKHIFSHLSWFSSAQNGEFTCI